MKISKIKIENFKSYKKAEIDCRDLNYIIGGNAAGKSNFVNVFKFFNDIIFYGLDDAILLQGGIKYLLNSNSSKKSNILLNIEIDFSNEENDIIKVFPIKKGIYLPTLFNYTICIKPNEKGEGYKVKSEEAYINFEKVNIKNQEKILIDKVKLNIKKDLNGIIKDNMKEKKSEDSSELFNLDFFIRFMKRDGLLLNNFFSSISVLYKYYSKIKIYNFDVNLLKSPSNVAARSELEENGSNLVNIIHQILKNKSQKNKLNKIIKVILPFVEDIKIENNINKSVFFKVKESYNNSEFPSYMLSDGTVNILAIIVALYFQDDNDIVIIEEPERNIHPKMLGLLVKILEDVSKSKQIFITTHNPYILKEANLNEVILISRGKDGISNISKPIDDKKVQVFLKNDLGIDELFVDGILR